METLQSIVAVMHLQQWMASVDLKDAPVMPAHHQFLRFSWLDMSYQLGILSFGLSLAPRVFTKTLVPS